MFCIAFVLICCLHLGILTLMLEMFLKCFLTLSFWKQCTHVWALFPGNFYFTIEWRGVIVYPQFPRVCFSLRPFNLHKTIPHFQPNETCDQVFYRGSNQKRRACFDPQFYIFQFNCASHSAFFIIVLSFSGSLLGSLLSFFFFFNSFAEI